MQISFHGLGCFTLRGKDAALVTDPFDPKTTGVRLKKLTADVVTLSHGNGNGLSPAGVSAKEGAPVIVDWPGEYEYRGISIVGTQSWQNKKELEGSEKSNTIFTYLIDDIHICHLGALGHSLTNEQTEEIGEVDILLIPVGGIGSFDVAKAKEVVGKIEPRIVIPMHYAVPGLKTKLGPLDAFLKLAGNPSEKSDVLKISKRELPAEESTKILVLNVT